MERLTADESSPLPIDERREVGSRLAARPAISFRRVAEVSRSFLMLSLVVALAGGFILRLWQLNTLGFNSDEAVYAGQAAAIAGDTVLKPFFPMFRAHPLLFQFIVSLGFLSGASDLVARLLSVACGMATVFVVYLLGSILYGRPTGILAAGILALMPYHIIVTRQMILDGPMTLFATLSLYLIARFATTQRPQWLYAAASTMGLTFLTKETGIILVGAIYAFLALSPTIRVRLRDLAISLLCLAAVVAVFPLAITLAGGGGGTKTQSYLLWQLFRTPNHIWTFYLSQIPPVVGPLVILAAALGIWLPRRARSWRETLLLVWIIVPVAFFQLWPVKGFQYWLPIAPALAVLAARGLARIAAITHMTVGARRVNVQWAPKICVALVALSLVIPGWQWVQATPAGPVLAGAGGIPGGREAGEWIKANVPEGAQLLTIGPSMANILQFYGHRKAMGLSVSTNPLRRNPSYQPVVNPDLQIRNGEFQYLVYDAFSAARSDYYSEELLGYARRYRGRIVHEELVPVKTPAGTVISSPVIVIYEVTP